jgi:hypothetical protein
MMSFNFLRKPKKPNCASEIYRKLDSKPEDNFGQTPGGYVRNVPVVVEEIEEPTRSIDEIRGAKRAWARCADNCEEKLYVVFRSGGAKTTDANEVRFGDMEPGKTYSVEGYTMIDHDGTLVITNLV